MRMAGNISRAGLWTVSYTHLDVYKRQELYLVDLPGYGYAKVSEQEKAKWGKLIERYLHGSAQLKAVFLLIDIRHDPSANDKICLLYTSRCV